jgi:predicted TIM-barrel fold metal-dependent hydrolase
VAIPGEPYDDILTDLLADVRRALPAGVAWTDAHTHTGFNDPDGVTGSAEELLAGLDRAGIARAVVFTTAEPGGYPPANDRVLAEAEAAGGRLTAFTRVDPNAEAPLDEARRGFAAGARGIKLHPRSDDFALPHPEVESLVALAAERRAPVLFHAGRGIPALGEEVIRLAGAYPDARLILAHAGISDLGLLQHVVATLPNVFFDTSWWQVADLLTLMSVVPPGQILFASDMPYGSARFAALTLLRCALEVGHEPRALAAMAGRQVERLLAGEEPLDAGAAPGPRAVGHRWLAGERIVSYSSAALQMAFRENDPTEPLALARLACQVPTGGSDGDEARLLGACDRFLALAQELLAETPDDPRRVRYAALTAHLLAGTPRVPV